MSIDYMSLLNDVEDKLLLKKYKNYYNGRKLLSSRDINGNEPDIFISQTLRSYGKTTFYNVLLWEGFLKYGYIFGLQVRHKYELAGIENTFVESIQDFYKNKIEIKVKNYMNGSVKELIYMDGEEKTVCGYAFALRGSNAVKRCSNMLSSIDHYLMDELLPEDDVYVPDEIVKFRSIHTSISREAGKQIKQVPVYLCTNRVKYLNPYYMEFGITERIQERTRKMKGTHWVFENGVNEELAKKHMCSGFNRAFQSSDDLDYITGKLSLKSMELIDIGKIKGKKKYIMTIMCRGDKFGLYRAGNIYYVSESYDSNYKIVYGVTREDVIICGKTSVDIKFFKNMFEYGFFRFQNAKCKKVGLEFLLLS